MNPALIPAAIDGIAAVVRLIREARAVAKRDGTLTEEQDREYDRRLEEIFKQAHWQVD